MIRDWDLWPIYLDRHWMDAESAKRLAAITDHAVEVIRAFGITLQEATERLNAAFSHAPATRR